MALFTVVLCSQLNSSYQLSGKSLSIRQAYLVWIPFSLPSNTTEVGSDHVIVM